MGHQGQAEEELLLQRHEGAADCELTGSAIWRVQCKETPFSRTLRLHSVNNVAFLKISIHIVLPQS